MDKATRNTIVSAIRRVFSRSAVSRKAKEMAVHPTIVGIRGGKKYICSQCGIEHSANNVEVDHSEMVVPIHRSINDMDWNEYIERMFCDVENLSVLCKECHLIKTNEEKTQRKEYKERVRIQSLAFATLMLHKSDLKKKYYEVDVPSLYMFKKAAIKEWELYNDVWYFNQITCKVKEVNYECK